MDLRLDFLGEFRNDIVGVVDVIVELNHNTVIYTAQIVDEWVFVALRWNGGIHLLWSSVTAGEGLLGLVLLFLLFLKLLFNLVPFRVLFIFNFVVVFGVRLVSGLEKGVFIIP